jgi:hypothetical protein
MGVLLLGLMLLLDLVATHFSQQIEAALILPTTRGNNTTAGVIHTATETPTLPPLPEHILAQDTFQRADQTFWGIASDGQSWRADAMSSPHFTVANHMGQVTNASGIFDALIGARVSNSEVVFSGSVSHYATTSSLGAILRWTDMNNLYKAYIDGKHLILLKKVAGVVTVLKVVSFIAQDATSYTFRFRAVGPLLSLKVWPTNQAEPPAWMITTNDSALTSGYDGIRLVLQNSTTGLIISFVESGL